MVHSTSKNFVSFWNLIYMLNWGFQMIYLIEYHTFICVSFMVFFELTVISDCKEGNCSSCWPLYPSLHFCEAILFP